MNTARKPSVVFLLMLFAWVSLVPRIVAQPTTETLLSTENAYNAIPSPDGKYLAYVRTGWGRHGGSIGFGRSDLVSEIAVVDGSGKLVAKTPHVDAFLSGWTPDGTELVCYRDGEYFLVSVNGKHSIKGRLPAAPNVIGTERVSYLPRAGMMIWSQQNGFLATPNGVLAEVDAWLGAVTAPSPDGRYVAIAGVWPNSHLWVYDIDLKKWADLGEADIHSDPNWDYIKPSWNPWFANSSRLAYFTHNNSVLSISTPDGRHRRDIPIEGPAGLAAASPDGRSVAYVTFEPRPGKVRPDLQFWGGTQVWVVSVSGKPEPRPVTLESLDETYDLRWLNDHTLVFDRVADVALYKQSRIWKVDVPR